MTLIRMLRTLATRNSARTGCCLSADDLAAFVDGGLAPRRRAAAEAHLADCNRCLEALAAIGRAASGARELPPKELVESAVRLHAEPVPARSRLPAWVAAAAVLLAVGLLTQIPSPGTVPSGPEDDGVLLPRTRGIDGLIPPPRLLAPAVGSDIRPRDRVFRWTEVPGSLFYDVRLVSPDGDVLVRERVAGTRWSLPDRVKLELGEEYFFRVDAYLSDAKYLSSEHVPFRVGRER